MGGVAILDHTEQSGQLESWRPDTSGRNPASHRVYIDGVCVVVLLARDGQQSKIVKRESLLGGTAPLFQEQQRERFFRLASLWRRERQSGMDIHVQIEHPAYREIVGMGEAVIPYVLEEMRNSDEFWFPALAEITGATPVPKSSYGSVRKVKEAWLDWGRDQGYHCGVLDR